MISIPKNIPGFLTKTLVLSVGAASTLLATTHAQPLGSVFVIEMENRNWTQPSTDTSAPSQILGNAAAPYINSLVTPGNANAAQVAYCSAYHNVLATPTGANPSIHPSEPNYIWQEAGSNLGVANDNDPYGSGKTVASIQAYLTANPSVSGENFSGLLQSAGVSWKSYQEDTDLATLGSTYANGNQAAYTGTLGSNQLTNAPVSPGQFTVPLTSFSGTSTNYTNAYNGSHQYNFATKHDGTLFFPATNGGNDASSANTFASRYAPLQQLSTDLTNNAGARYNLITPNQYNDMHTALSGGYTYNGTHYTGDLAQVAQGDNFLAILIPQIMASAAYQNNGAIVIWLDETEGTN